MCQKWLILSVLLSTFIIAGCGSSSSDTSPVADQDNDNGSASSSSSSEPSTGGDGGFDELGLGQVTLTVSGAVNGEFSGMMDFHYLEFDDFGVAGARWELSGHDSTGGIQTFSLTFSIESFADGGESIDRPDVGTYEIGFDVHDSQVFSAIFTHLGEGGVFDSTEYISESEIYTGTLTITESTSSRVSGSFVADLYSEDYCLADGCVGDSVNITGEFTANERQF